MQERNAQLARSAPRGAFLALSFGLNGREAEQLVDSRCRWDPPSVHSCEKKWKRRGRAGRQDPDGGGDQDGARLPLAPWIQRQPGWPKAGAFSVGDGGVLRTSQRALT